MNTKGFVIFLHSFLGLGLLASLPFMGVTPVSAAGVIYVDINATGAGTGGSWQDAFTDLQSAISAAGPGDQIWVAAGTYKPTSGADRTASFALGSGVAIYGGFNGSEALLTERDWVTNVVTLSGDIGIAGDSSDNSYHVVYADGVNATCVLDGVTIIDGNAISDGGGMYNVNSSPTLANLVFSNNSAPLGGGMLNILSNPSLTNVTFNENIAASSGGGLYNLNSNPSLTKVTFMNNTAVLEGGGLYNYFSSPSLSNITFHNNTASFGGGIYNDGSSPSLTNVTFSGNSATNEGGAIFHSNDSAGQINDSILWADGSSEVFVDPTIPTSTITINDSIVEGGCPTGSACTRVSSTDPLLGPLADNGGFTQTMALGDKSPAIDTGDGTTCADTDQRGIKRPQGPSCDMGAYEVQSFTLLLKSLGAQDGWILESTETSGTGGTLNRAAAGFFLGDDSLNRQYRAILSFNTSTLPPGATITSVRLKIMRYGLVGTNPFATHQSILVDMRTGAFRDADALEIQDFQTLASKSNAFSIRNMPISNWYSGALGAANFLYVNRSGLTQFRLRFRLDDNNDLGADYLKFYSGNASAPSVRPKLIITYYVP